MSSTEHRVEEWNDLILKVRSVYSGNIVYNANHGMEDGSEWFRNLDYMGISAYYEIAKNAGAPLEEMIAGWRSSKEKLLNLHEKFVTVQSDVLQFYADAAL